MGFPLKRARCALEQTKDLARAAELLAMGQEEEGDEYDEEGSQVEDEDREGDVALSMAISQSMRADHQPYKRKKRSEAQQQRIESTPPIASTMEDDLGIAMQLTGGTKPSP